MRVNDGRQSQEHEYDGLRDRGQHLHEVLDRGGRLLGHVGLRVLSHDDASKGQPEMVKDLQLLKTYPCLGPIDFTTNIVTHLKTKILAVNIGLPLLINGTFPKGHYIHGQILS